jgi:hypothetical protein
MHTDEYEISLLKEVAVCSRYIRSLENTLRRLEEKHHLPFDEVVKKDSGASASVDGSDRAKWLAVSQALASWKKRRAEYEELHRQMKK